jgi:hypothetical protein
MGAACSGEKAPYTVWCTWVDDGERILIRTREREFTLKNAEIPLYHVPENVHQLKLTLLRHFDIEDGTPARFQFSETERPVWLELNSSVNVPELFKRQSEIFVEFNITHDGQEKASKKRHQ